MSLFSNSLLRLRVNICTHSNLFFGINRVSFSTQPNATSHAVGVQYERQMIERLNALNIGLSLIHKGGSGDGGIDFWGAWKTVAASNEDAKEFIVIGQCKRWKKRIGASTLRELVGTATHLPKDSTVRFAASTMGFTDLARAYANEPATGPMVLITWNDESLVDFWLNPAARKILPSLRIGFRHSHCTVSVDSASKRSRDILLWMDK
eukprot:TRINITY_DN13470_c0_g1_i1.p1 TRINITY_DN13470_c0_g1~~TRINITY_DN13470_c0_g1_i1.p1  ORF type:complete len:207 (+),score=48.15 TRINITY_DN13470_c0_g1_i1:52-672(+)